MSEKTVVVTGAAGMIGSHLCERLLEADYGVTAIDDCSVGTRENLSMCVAHPAFRFVEADVRDARVVTDLAEGASAIIHLAARKKIGEQQAGIETLTVNSRGTENVLEAARIHGAKVVFASTSDVYGMSTALPFREDGDLLLGPSMIKRWSYAVSKLYGEQLAFAYYKDLGVSVVVLRYFGGFSDRASFSWSGGHVPLFIDAILKNEPVVVHGDGSQTRSMGYVEDLVDGTLLSLEKDAAIGQIINLGNPEEVSVLDCAKRINQIIHGTDDVKVRFVPMHELFGSYKDIQRRSPDISRAQELLGWSPKFSFDDAIRMTVESRKRQLGL